MARTNLIAGNWKMNKGGAEGVTLAHAVADGCKGRSGVEVVVCPPATALAAVASTLADVSGNIVEVGAQNLYPKDSGAYTGEFSAPMLLEAGCKWVIIGHSERREYFKESDEFVAEKSRVAQAAGLRPIICIGETLDEREAGKTLDVVATQLAAVIDILADQPGHGVIAYEPIWAIGTGKTAGPEQAQEVHGMIRAKLKEKSEDLAEKTRILYGGSMKPANAADLLACADVDGGLIGGASLKPDDFLAIVQAAG